MYVLTKATSLLVNDILPDNSVDPAIIADSRLMILLLQLTNKLAARRPKRALIAVKF